MEKIVKTAALVFALGVLVSGCSTVAPGSAPVMTAPVVSTEAVVERSYTLGAEQSAFVGGSIARVKDYLVEKTTRQGAMHASRDFTLFYPILGPRVFVNTTDVIPIVGTTERGGTTYQLVALPQVPLVKLLIRDDGSFEGSGLGLGDSRMGYSYSPEPSNVRLRSDSSTSSTRTPGNLNFELIFSGVTKDSIRLLYREYTQNDLARPAFSQDIVYERDAPTIRFRNILLRVVQVTGEQLKFVVLEDGYPPMR
jgi:hypothetical protein